jgi:hypothetical protein
MQYRNIPQRQRGMSKWGWLIAIALAVGAVTTALKLGPHYVDFRMVQGVLERLPAGQVHKSMSRKQIQDHFAKQFRVESFRIPLKDVLKINRDREQTQLDINYEVREHLFYNIDVVLSFSEQRTYQ